PWRYTADMLYLLENPEVHEVFFPSGASDVAIETASAVDEPEIRAIGGTPCGPGGPNLSARRRRLFRAQCASDAPGSRQLPGSSCYCSSSSDCCLYKPARLLFSHGRNRARGSESRRRLIRHRSGGSGQHYTPLRRRASATVGMIECPGWRNARSWLH